MKSKIFNVIILILMLFVTAISLNGRVSHREGSIIEITHFSGKGVHLMTIYGDSVPLPASLQGKKLSKIHYNGEDGIEVEDMEVVKLYSGDEGFGTSQIGN